jgi:hypothetical protein
MDHGADHPCMIEAQAAEDRSAERKWEIPSAQLDASSGDRNRSSEFVVHD